MIKFCIGCNTNKKQSDFSNNKSSSDGLSFYCRVCKSNANKSYYTKNRVFLCTKGRNYQRKAYGVNKANILFSNKKYKERVFEKVLSGYGNKCACCGEQNKEFLTLDHVNRDGASHRKIRHQYGIYRDVINSGFPNNYRILCMNCNWATRYSMVCPHIKKFSKMLETTGPVRDPKAQEVTNDTRA